MPVFDVSRKKIWDFNLLKGLGFYQPRNGMVMGWAKYIRIRISKQLAFFLKTTQTTLLPHREPILGYQFKPGSKSVEAVLLNAFLPRQVFVKRSYMFH